MLKSALNWQDRLYLLLKLFIKAEKNAIINFKLLYGEVRREKTSFSAVV